MEHEVPKQSLSDLEKEVAERRLLRGREAVLEMHKLWFEALKNQTTLSAGAVVAYAAVTAGLLPEPRFVWVLGLSYAFILISIVTTVSMMRSTALSAGEMLMPNEGMEDQSTPLGLQAVPYSISSGGFVLSLICFLAFFTINLLVR